MVPYDYGQMAGRGFENVTQQDVGVPFLNLLQANSPEVTDGDAKQVKGAKAGMFMDSISKQLFDGEKGIVLVPCATQHVFVEWVPRDAGCGFVAVHTLDSEVVKKVTQGRRVTGKLKMPTCEAGRPFNDLIETYYVFALALASAEDTEPFAAYVLAFTSTKIKHYRASIGDLRKWKAGVPLFAHRLVMTSWNDKNKKGQPFKNLRLGPSLGTIEASLIPPTNPLIKVGMDLLTSIEGGSAQAAYQTSQEDSAESDESDKVFK